MTEDQTQSSGWSAGADVAAQLEKTAQRIARREPALKAFRDLHLESARARAGELDASRPEDRRPLHGLSVAVKEIFEVAGMRCEWGSPVHADRVPERDSKLVRDVKSAGAIIVGTTASTEYAMGRVPPTENPFDPERTPGASSAGSAAAVGAGLLPCALGSQTIGSCIRPASYSGVLGFKPSHGVLSTDGIMPLSGLLDHAAIFAEDFDVLERLFSVLAGDKAVASKDIPAGAGTVVLTLPCYDEAVDASVTAALDDAARLFGEMGYAVERRDLAAIVAGEEDCLTTILSHDMALNHSADYERAGDQMSDFLRGWIEAGSRVTEEQYESAIARRAEIIAALENWLPERGVVLTAATTGPAPLRSQGTGSRAPQRLWTLAGWPALAVPGWWKEHLPIGVQLVATSGADWQLLSVGRQLFRTARNPSASNGW